MKKLTISEIQTIVRRDENRIMEAKKTTGELIAGCNPGAHSSIPKVVGFSFESIPLQKGFLDRM